MGTERHTEAASTEVARRRPPAQQATSLQPNVATPDLQILSLQRTIGNQAVVGLLRERSKRGSAPGRRDNGPAQLGALTALGTGARPRTGRAPLGVQRVFLPEVEEDLGAEPRLEIRAWLQERVGPIDWAAYDKANYLSEQKFNFEGLPRLEIEGQEPSKPAPEKPAPKAQVIEPQDPVNVFLDLITSKGDLLERLRRWKEAKAKGNAEPKPLDVTEAERIEGIIKKTEGVGPHLPKIRLDPAQIIILDEPSFVQSHFNDVAAKNAKRGFTGDDIKTVQLLDRSNIDLVQGFTSVDNKIYLRRGLVTDHVLIHEALHKLTSNAFEQKFGHHLNEATTEIIARWVCKQNSIPSEDSAYRLERALFALAFQEKLGLELGDVSPAYLAGQHLDVIYQMFCDWLTGPEEFYTPVVNFAKSIFGKAEPDKVGQFVNEKSASKAFAIAQATAPLKGLAKV